MRILHLADLHLGCQPSGFGAAAADRRRERDSLLERAVDVALDPRYGADLVIIAGDLFESHAPPADLADEVLRQLRRIDERNIPLITVPGNHDEISYADSLYNLRAEEWPGRLVQNPHPQHIVTLELPGGPCHLYSAAYTGGLSPQDLTHSALPRLDEPGVHIGVFHGILADTAGESLGAAGPERCFRLSLESLAEARYHYTALGHLHKHQTLEYPGGVAVYCGAAEGKSFEDPGTGSFVLAEVGRGGAEVRLVPAGCRPIVNLRIDAASVEDAAALVEAARRGAPEEACVRVTLEGAPRFPLAVGDLEEALKEAFAYVEVRDHTLAPAEELLELWAAEPSVRGLFIRRMRERIEAAADETSRRRAERALAWGLKAFSGRAG